MGISPFLAVAAAFNMVEGEPAWPIVVITGLILVFGVLVLLYLLISVEGIIFSSIDRKNKPTPARKETKPVSAPAAKKTSTTKDSAPAVQAGIPGEVVAAIAAAVSCMEGAGKYRIRSIARAKTGRSAWSQAGVVSYTDPF